MKTISTRLHPSQPHRPRPSHGGFTLLEITVAITIFSIVVTALYSTYRTGVRSYALGHRTVELMQSIRFTTDLFRRDVKNVYFQTESDYNVNYNRLVDVVLQLRARQENEGLVVEDDLLDKIQYGGIEINLTMEGKDNAENDEVSFVTTQPSDGSYPVQPWGLARVRYFVNDGALYRQESPVYAAPRDILGNPTEENPYEEPPELLTEGVVRFDLRYGFFFEDDWFEAEDWDSSAVKHRNPPEEEEEELTGEDRYYQNQNDYAQQIRSESSTPQGPVDYTNYLEQQKQKSPDDNLPTYVSVTLTIRDPLSEKHPKTIKSLIYLPESQETYIPPETEEEREQREREQREAERSQQQPGQITGGIRQ